MWRFYDASVTLRGACMTLEFKLIGLCMQLLQQYLMIVDSDTLNDGLLWKLSLIVKHVSFYDDAINRSLRC